MKKCLIYATVTNTIRPAINFIGYGGVEAEQLILHTGLVESGLVLRKQLGGGPALGLFQCEPATLNDIYKNYLAYRPDLFALVEELRGDICSRSEALRYNDNYAAAICRIHYLRVREELPRQGDIKAQARYWKRFYNTHRGAGTVSDAKWNDNIYKDINLCVALEWV